MINPEWFVIGVLIYITIMSVLKITAGAIKADKPEHYGLSDVADGVTGMIVVIICILI